MSLSITPLYAAALAVIFLVLMIGVIYMRAKTGISLLHGDNPALLERMRRYGNFVETVPLALVLLIAAELAGAGASLLHTVGGLLLAGRVLHPFGINAARAALVSRIVGTLATQVSILIAAGYLAMQGLGM